MNTRVHFHEVQFQPLWLRLIMVGVGVGLFIGMYRQIVQGYPLGTHPAPDWVLIIIWLAIGVFLPLFSFFSRLEIMVNEKGILYRYFPLQPRFIVLPYSRLTTIQVVRFHPLLETGGWGIRWGLGGICYTVRGNEGIQCTLENGKKILLGSQRSAELYETIQKTRT